MNSGIIGSDHVVFYVAGVRMSPSFDLFTQVGQDDYRCFYNFRRKDLASQYPGGVLVRIHKHQGVPVVTTLDDTDTLIDRNILPEHIYTALKEFLT